jgi:hypothetical protein
MIGMKLKSIITESPLNMTIPLVMIFLGIFVSGCDKEISVTPPEQPPQNGKLFVNSDPPDAYIYLNGKNTGDLTPLSG